MRILYLFFYLIVSINVFVTLPAYSRCAVCVIDGMSGASMAILIILSVFIILAIANWCLKKILEKTKYQ
tara:strand:- start:191 stop:397 length:207 start_codon:yes stop_codon:yes gene_type:complete